MNIVLIVLLVYYLICFGWLMAASYPTRFTKYRLVFKCLSSAGFLALLLSCGVIAGFPPLFFRMLPAFIFCFAGDVFMAITDARWNDRIFLIGMGSFAVAHLLFLIMFFTRAAFVWWELIIPICVLAFAVISDKLGYTDPKKNTIPSYAYSVIVGWIFARALVCALAVGFTPQSLVLLVAGGCFLASDMLLYVLYFTCEKKQRPVMRFINLFTYYAAMALFALSLLF